MKLQILSPGLQTTVQDRGRLGYQAAGIGVSGAMDREAYESANYLVGNRRGEAALEMTLLGAAIRFDEDCVCALTGADMGAVLDGDAVERYRPFLVSEGQRLVMGYAAAGCRGYLAIQGGIDVPEVLGSRSTNLRCAMGGYEGRALRRGDILSAPGGVDITVLQRKRPVPVLEQTVTVCVVPGPQADAFTQQGLRTLWEQPFVLSDKSDRMGFRLEGPAIETVSGSDIVSDGITLGSIQVTSGGQPIILMADRQTTGGYAKVGTVCSFDIPKLAQLRPGGLVRFDEISVEAAQRRYRRKRWRHFFEAI